MTVYTCIGCGRIAPAHGPGCKYQPGGGGTEEHPQLFADVDECAGLDEATIQAKFEAFHRENPDVYWLFVRFARALKEKGYLSAGVKLLTERVRWEVMMETDDPSSEFKINNNYTSRYARLIMEQEPDLDGFFEIRTLRTP